MNLKKKFEELLKCPTETEWLDFKEAKFNFDFNGLGEYFSALSNEANLKGLSSAWLVFGVSDKRIIVGTQYLSSPEKLEKLKKNIADQTTGRITFTGIHELELPEGRVLLFQIPPAPKGFPIAWKGHFYGRDGESLVALNIQEIEEIRNQVKFKDWSAQICEKATLNDLESKAILKARQEYKNKFPLKSKEVEQWNDVTFLNKAKITIQGKITNTAILLLGKEESDHFISPAVAKITWVLKDENNIEKSYEHFGIPFLINSEAAYSKIRNLKYAYLPNGTLFPVEIEKYEPYIIREALHNCIAHQDYELGGRINLVEKPDELIFTNLGEFIPQSVENVIAQDAPPTVYRNQFLTTAMFNLNMIETIGSGIKKMFLLQKERYFPLPDYHLENPKEIKVCILGKIIDENYTKLLKNHKELNLETVMLLDKVQKKKKLSTQEITFLKKKKFIEGRSPNFYVASKIAEVTGDKTSYIKNRAFDKEHYKKMILAFIGNFGAANRKEIDQLLLDKLSDSLNEKQKETQIKNLLAEMSKKDKTIKNSGSQQKPNWVLA